MNYTTYYTITIKNDMIDISTFTRFSDIEWSGWSNTFPENEIRIKKLGGQEGINLVYNNNELTVDTDYNVTMIDDYYIVKATGQHSLTY